CGSCRTTSRPASPSHERSSSHDSPATGWYSMTTASTLAQLCGDDAYTSAYSPPSQSILTSCGGAGAAATAMSKVVVGTSTACRAAGPKRSMRDCGYSVATLVANEPMCAPMSKTLNGRPSNGARYSPSR